MTKPASPQLKQEAVAMFFILDQEAAPTAEMYERTPETIRRWVREVHPDYVFASGRAQATCARGHDMSKTRVVTSKGKSYCGECRRVSQSTWARNEYHASAQAKRSKKPERGA